MAVDDDEANVATIEDKISLAARVVNRQQWMVLGFILLLLIVSVVGMFNLVNVHKTTSTMVAEKSENRFNSYSAKISRVQVKVEQQYQQHLSKMEDQSIFAVNKKFRVIYDISQQSERDYVALLELYQQLAYDAASRVKGSGEWYYYYEQKIANFIKKAKARDNKMQQYFHNEAV